MHQQLALSVNFGQGISDAWSKVASFVPKLLAFLVILAIGWFIAKALAKVVDRGLRKIGSEKVSERAGIARALRGSSYDVTGIISKIIYYALLLVVLQLAFGVFGPNAISDMITSVVSWLPKGIVAVVIVVIAMAIANAVRDIVSNALAGASYGRTLASICWVFIVALGAFAALGQAGIATAVTGPVLIAVLATIAGILIVGVGGGLIIPMRERCERWLDTAERETANARQSIDAYQQGRADALDNQPAQQMQPQQPTDGTGYGDQPQR